MTAIYITESEIEDFKKEFPHTSNADLAVLFGTSIRTVIRRARELGLFKSKEYLNIIGKERRAKITPRSGADHHNWKGGKPWKRFSDPRYREWRKTILERDEYTCQDCQRKCGKYEKGLAAHHIKEYAIYPDLRYDIDNGLTLCRECHMRLHNKIFTITMVKCACGCGAEIPDKDRYGRDRSYVNHHARRGKTKNK